MEETIINTTDIEKAKKLIQQAKRPIIIRAQSNEFNRALLEYGKFDVLLSLESGERKDSLKQLDSGLNHVLARIAQKKNIAIGIDIKEIRQYSEIEKAKKLARIRQNIELCRKSKVAVRVINGTDQYAVFSILLSLGASTEQATKAISF